MIFTDRTIIVQKGISSINDTIILYRGDKGVEIRFTLNEGSPFRFGSGASPNIIEKTEAAYGQLVIKTPNDLPAIFSEVVPTNEGKIVFTITGEMIDEITEVGYYTFQIRLFDENQQSRATIPEVINGIEIREPIAIEGMTNTNEADAAAVGYALTTAGTQEDTFDSQGNYNKTTWGTGDRITASKLNKIEAGIDGVNRKVSNVDLSNYVTKEQGNANQITFSDGQTFQAKLDAGTLKGDKGDKGDVGPQGPQGIQGPAGTTTASGVSITDTANNFTATDVEGALQEAGSQIKDIEEQVNSYNSTIKKSNIKIKSFATFIDDDGRIEAYTKLLPIFSSKKVPFTVAISTGRVGQDGYMTLQQLKELQNTYKCEISSHYVEHGNITPEDSASSIERQMGDSRKWCEDNNLSCPTVTYVGGTFNPLSIDIAKKYYDCGFQYDSSKVNTSPIRQYAIYRQPIKDPITLEGYKSIIDHAISKNAWIVFSTHSWMENEMNENQYNILPQIIDYILSKGIEIVNPSVALKIFGNVIDIGDECANDGYFRVGRTGYTETNLTTQYNNIKSVNYRGVTVDTPITDFMVGYTTTITFSLGENSGFPVTNAGILKVFRQREDKDELSFQEWIPNGKNITYRRYWDNSNGTWLPWNDGNSLEIVNQNTYNSTSTYTDFETGKIIYNKISGASSSQFPDGNGGNLVIDASINTKGNIRQSFYTYNSIKNYERYMDSSGNWSNWYKKIYGDSITINVESQTIPANSVIEISLPANNIIGQSDTVMATPFAGLENGVMFCCFAKSNIIVLRLHNTTTSTITTGSRNWKFNIIKFI